MLTDADIERFRRQIALPGVGTDGQERLRGASIAVIGAGGLGSPALLYLAAAGVGRLRIVDGDRVQVSNLHRQLLHETPGIGMRKIESARQRIAAIDPAISVDPIDTTLSAVNARDLLRGFDLALDCTDNFAARYVINDAAFFEKVPLVHAAVHRFEAQVTVFAPPDGPCYRCLHPSPPPEGMAPSCEEGGVLGVTPGLAGLWQATEAVKWILGIGTPLIRRLMMVDLLEATTRTIRTSADEHCILCGRNAQITDVVDTLQSCDTGGFMNEDVTPAALNERIQQGDTPRLVDVREQWEWDLAHLDGAQHIPLGQLAARADELPRNEEIVVYCRSGARSDRAAQWLRQQGFENVRNLLGGILRWSSEVDPSIPRY